MVILTLNCGSSSAKYQVYDWENKDVLASGVSSRFRKFLKIIFCFKNCIRKSRYRKCYKNASLAAVLVTAPK